jgi:hypothetical protein
MSDQQMVEVFVRKLLYNNTAEGISSDDIKNPYDEFRSVYSYLRPQRRLLADELKFFLENGYSIPLFQTGRPINLTINNMSKVLASHKKLTCGKLDNQMNLESVKSHAHQYARVLHNVVSSTYSSLVSDNFIRAIVLPGDMLDYNCGIRTVQLYTSLYQCIRISYQTSRQDVSSDSLRVKHLSISSFKKDNGFVVITLLDNSGIQDYEYMTIDGTIAIEITSTSIIMYGRVMPDFRLEVIPYGSEIFNSSPITYHKCKDILMHCHMFQSYFCTNVCCLKRIRA